MVSLLVAQVNLVLQVVVFVLLVSGLFFGRKHQVKYHAQFVLSAIVLNLVSFIAVMAPSMRNSNLWGTSLSFLSIAHGFFGASASLLSVWVIGVWLFSPLVSVPAQLRCDSALSKKLMTAAISLWLASLILGFILFASLHSKLV